MPRLLGYLVSVPPTLVPAGLSERLAQFIRKLCGAIGDYGLKHRSVLPVLNLAVTRLFRLSAQFADLVAKVLEGRLPAQRTTRRRADPAPARALPPGSEAEASASVPGPPMPELPRLPRDFGWLLRLTPGDHWVRGYRGYIEQWLADPELLAMLEAAPPSRAHSAPALGGNPGYQRGRRAV